MIKGYIYILKSVNNGQYYVGSTLDVKRRFVQHAAGLVKSTRHNRPWELVFVQCYNDIKDARRIEYSLKRWKRRDIIDRIVRDKKILLGDWRSWERV